jgi:sn-glycerol 3-phosphate transport system permease protein
VLPQVVVTGVFFLWPAFDSLCLSLFKAWPFGDRLLFVGLEDFRRLLSSPDCHRIIVNSVVFAAGVTCLGLPIALFVAFLAGQKVRGLSLYRAALLWAIWYSPAGCGDHLALYLSPRAWPVAVLSVVPHLL